jgi:hypothetical protein
VNGFGGDADQTPYAEVAQGAKPDEVADVLGRYAPAVGQFLARERAVIDHLNHPAIYGQ